MSSEPAGVQFSETQWAGLVKRIKSIGRLDFDPPAPRAPAAINALKEDQRRWCYAWVKTGGNIYEAARAGNYSTPAGTTAARLLQRQDIRTFIALLFETVQRRLEQKREKQRIDRETSAEAKTAEIVRTIAAPPAAPTDARVQAQIERQSDEIAELLEHALRVLRTPIGDFISINGDGSWSVDPIAVKAAPAGIIKSVQADDYGRMKITVSDPDVARKFLMDYHTAKSGLDGDRGHGDVRNLIVNIINGKPEDWRQLDAVAKQAGAQLRAANKTTHGAVKIEKAEADAEA